jgi:hypothetical protein
MKGSDLLVAALENEGVDRIFGVPGEENLDVVESLRRSSIELVVTAFMAAIYGWLPGKSEVALITLALGALNLVNAKLRAAGLSLHFDLNRSFFMGLNTIHFTSKSLKRQREGQTLNQGPLV